MREFEEGWTKARIVLEFGHVLLDVGGGDASVAGKGQHVAECLSPGEIFEAN